MRPRRPSGKVIGSVSGGSFGLFPRFDQNVRRFVQALAALRLAIEKGIDRVDVPRALQCSGGQILFPDSIADANVHRLFLWRLQASRRRLLRTDRNCNYLLNPSMRHLVRLRQISSASANS
jgi:hypothetical protein